MPETGPDTPSLVMGDSHGSRICWDPGPGTAEPKKQFLVSGRGWEKVLLGLWGQISLLSSGTCWKSSGMVINPRGGKSAISSKALQGLLEPSKQEEARADMG